MKRFIGLLVSAFVFGAGVLMARAEDSVSLWGNYYKERSTRVVEPIVSLRKALPAKTQADVTYLVDQITSASGAFTVTDSAFREYRQEIRLGLATNLGLVTPGVRFRYSNEPDYRSIGIGADLEFALRKENTRIKLYIERLIDKVGQRTDPSFEDELGTTLVGMSWTETLRRDLLAGISLEAQVLRGYQENPYRIETHPRERNRFSVAGFLGYHVSATKTTPQVGYRYYWDNWELHGHAVDLQVTQRLHTDVEVTPKFRYYTQDGLFFETPIVGGFLTSDPKLMAFDSQLYGITIGWTQGWLHGTPLSALRDSRIEPSYAYLNQHNFYGPAHIAQLGWYWPF